MENLSLLEIAIRTSKEPWSSVDEKLGALSGLESIASKEAADALVDVMSLTGLYSSSADKSSMVFPIHGEVAGAAARALGRIDNPATGVYGAQFLIAIAWAKEQPEGLRECALYGLGGLSHKSIFESFAEFVKFLEGKLLLRLLLSVQESYKRIEAVSTPYASAFLVSLFDSVASRYSTLSQEVLSLVAKIVADNLPDKGEDEIVALAKQPRRGGESWLAVKVLCNRGRKTPLQVLANILGQSGYPPEIYDDVVSRLSIESPPVVRTVLNDATVQTSIVTGFLSKVSSKVAASESARDRALQRLMEVVKSVNAN